MSGIIFGLLIGGIWLLSCSASFVLGGFSERLQVIQERLDNE